MFKNEVTVREAKEIAKKLVQETRYDGIADIILALKKDFIRVKPLTDIERKIQQEIIEERKVYTDYYIANLLTDEEIERLVGPSPTQEELDEFNKEYESVKPIIEKIDSELKIEDEKKEEMVSDEQNKENQIKTVSELIKKGKLEMMVIEDLKEIVDTTGFQLTMEEIETARLIAKNNKEESSEVLFEETFEDDYENTEEDYNDEWLGEIPEKCDLCKKEIKDFFIDGRTGHDLASPWGFMCEQCHQKIGLGLGIGFGQKYEKSGDKWICVEGLKNK